MIKLNAKQLRKGLARFAKRGYRVPFGSAQGEQGIVKKQEIYIILDNVLDTYNIGSIFRLADALAAKKIYLCGETETPPNPRIKKASINTTEVVDWEWCESAIDAIRKVKGRFSTSPAFGVASLEQKNNSSSTKRVKRAHGEVQIIAIEQSPRAIQYDKFEYKLPICLVVGHETNGVSKEVLNIADSIVEIPMFGINKSLNVMVSLGIVLYKVVEECLP